VALFIEGIGALFIFLESRKVGAQLHSAGFASYTGKPPPEFQGWYYDCGVLGFWLIMASLLFAGLALLLEHRSYVQKRGLV